MPICKIIAGSIVYLVCLAGWSSLAEASNNQYPSAALMERNCTVMFFMLLNKKEVEGQYVIKSIYSNKGVGLIKYQSTSDMPTEGVLYCGVNRKVQVIDIDLYTVLFKMGRVI
tara:strand:- start:1231 stop:1569 length:339 start_codon:yes stop_codon:yes gene_type:complete